MKMCVAASLDVVNPFEIIIKNQTILLQGVKKTVELTIIDTLYDNFFICKDINETKYAVYKVNDKLYCCIDINKQFLFGGFKECLSKFNFSGCLIDNATKTMWFRIPKNGSSCLMKIYSDDGNPFSGSNARQYKLLNEIDINQDDYFKYFIYRDFWGRLKSQINHFINHTNGQPRVMLDFVLNRYNSLMDILFKHYELSEFLINENRYNIQIENHAVHQSVPVREYYNSGFKFDMFVDLKDMKIFIENILHKKYIKYSCTGFNTSITTIPDNQIKRFTPFFEKDLELSSLNIPKYDNTNF